MRTSSGRSDTSSGGKYNGPSGTSPTSSSTSGCTPAPVRAETGKISASRPRSAAACSSATVRPRSSRSALLRAITTGRPARLQRLGHEAVAGPADALLAVEHEQRRVGLARARSPRAAACGAVSASRGRWTPGRSTSTSCAAAARRRRHAADRPAGRLRLVGDDRDLVADDRVHERRLADVGAPRERDEARPRAHSRAPSAAARPGARASPRRRSRGPCPRGAARRGRTASSRSSVCSGQITTSPSSRGPAGAARRRRRGTTARRSARPCRGGRGSGRRSVRRRRTSPRRGRPRCPPRRTRARTAARRGSAGSSAPMTSTSSMRATTRAARRPQLGRGALGMRRRRRRRSAARACGGRRPRRRSARTRSPSTPVSTSPTATSPDFWSRGRSIWVMSPVTTIFEPKPSRVRNIFICSGDGVLRLVEDDEGVVERAAAHERQRRDLDDAASRGAGRRARRRSCRAARRTAGAGRDRPSPSGRRAGSRAARRPRPRGA